MSEFLQVQQAKIRTLSPLHIGTGEDFSPVNYVITSAKKLGLFHTLVLGTVMGENVHKIKTIVENGHGKDMIFDLQQLIHSYKEELKTHLYRRIEVSQGFYDFYENRIKGDNKNLLEIKQTFTHPHNYHPIIAGSSIKGAIRTAILNFYANSAQYAHEILPENLLHYEHDVTKDIFQLLRISDTTTPSINQTINTRIAFSVNKKRNDMKGVIRLSVPLEFINEKTQFSCDMRLLQNHAEFPAPTDFPKDIATIAKLCNEYYLPKLQEELEELETHFKSSYVSDTRTLLQNKKTDMEAGIAFILRIGRYSTAHDKTFDKWRAIKTKKEQAATQSSTLWLLADDPKQRKDFLPFGWILIELPVIKSEVIDTPKNTIIWQNVEIQENKGAGEIFVVTKDGKAMTKDKSILTDAVKQKLAKKKVVKVDATVEKNGNQYTLITIEYNG